MAKLLFLTLVLLAGAAEAVTDTFTASGTWVAPAGVTSVTVGVWGGGGAGGGQNMNSDGGGGGGGGAYSQSTISVTPGNSYPVSVGAGGVGVAGGNGGNGGDSFFNNVATVFAKGGTGGSRSTGTPPVGGAGGAAVLGVGTVKFSGGNGGRGRNNATGRGGPGGSSAGTAANGTNGPDPWATATAAAAPAGGGIGGNGGNANGQNGFAPASGNGGGGGGSAEGTNRSGGNGAGGLVTITYTLPPSVASIGCAASCTTNAASISWTVTFSESVSGVTGSNFTLVNSGLGGTPAITSVTGAGVTWTVTASTGTGSGTLGLDMTNDIGVSPALVNLPFSGQLHTLDRIAPFVSSFARVDATPTSLANVSWLATFDESVTGVDATDFVLTQGGGLSGALITAVTPVSGTTYTVTASTGTGSGILGLGLVDDDSIVDGAGNPLGDAGTGNGDFSGESYSVIKPVTVTASPAACTNVTGPVPGTIAWNPASLTGPLASDNAYATASVNDNQTTDYLQCINYGFAIPTGATINGVTVNVERKASSTLVRDAAMRLVKDVAGAPVIQAIDRSTTTNYTTADVVEAHGGAADLWGAAWTPADINNTNFGAAFASQKAGTFGFSRTVSVDHISISVDYTPAVVTAPHHLEIQHASGTGVTCTPSTLTIKACADAACATPYADGVTGSLGATGTPAVKWIGGSGFTIPAGSSSVTKDVQVLTPGSVVFDATATPSASAATACNFGSPVCTFTAADSGFLISAPNHAAESSQTLTITAVKKADNSTACAPGLTGAKTVNLKCAYVNPGSGTLPVRVAGTALNATNDVAAVCDASGANISLSFDSSGVATPAMLYADVGEMQVSANYSDMSLTMVGAGSFIAVPAAFRVDGVTAGSIKAGDAFSATVSALNSAGSITPNFGKEGEDVTLATALVTPDPLVYPTAMNPMLGNNLIDSTEFGAGGMINTDADGVASVNNLSWDEVGSIKLTATLAGENYLGSGLSATGISATVGGFIPHHFDTAVVPTATTPMPCPNGLTCPASFNGFVYSGQPFSVQLFARNLAGGTTANYDGTFGLSRAVMLTAWDAPGGAAQNPGIGALANNAVAAATFAAGVAVAAPIYTFATTETAPTSIFMRAADTDGVSSLRTVPGDSVEGGVMVASGRLKLANAHGSELLPLPLTATVQYYNGTAWLRSATDTVTVLIASDIALAFPAGTASKPNNLTACETAASVTGVPPAFTINLSRPGSGNNGWANLTPNLGAVAAGNQCTVVGGAGAAATTSNQPWLQFPAGANPTARATFGVYKGNNDFIYMRENY